MSDSLLPSGTVFAGRYRIERPLGSGGMGAVYEATHTETERHVALKVMLPQFGQIGKWRTKFRDEARVGSKVRSEHIVDVLDAGIDDATGSLFLVMELLHGEELGKKLERGPLPSHEVVTYLTQVASALDKTHAANIVHRDLKPENLFLTRREDGSPRVIILDFGIAKILKEGSTLSTEAIGTPLYMAPEQFGEAAALSPATDIHALGLIAYSLLVGAAYWQEEADRNAHNPLAFALRTMHGPEESAVARALRRGHELPAEFDAWFFKATHFEPEHRFRQASVAVQELASVLAVQPVRALGPSGTSRMAKSDVPLDASRDEGRVRPAAAFGRSSTPIARDVRPAMHRPAAVLAGGTVGLVVAAVVISRSLERPSVSAHASFDGAPSGKTANATASDRTLPSSGGFSVAMGVTGAGGLSAARGVSGAGGVSGVGGMATTGGGAGSKISETSRASGASRPLSLKGHVAAVAAASRAGGASAVGRTAANDELPDRGGAEAAPGKPASVAATSTVAPAIVHQCYQNQASGRLTPVVPSGRSPSSWSKVVLCTQDTEGTWHAN